MKSRSQDFKEVALDVVGGANFGRYPKVSSENTFNMIESDGWLVPYAGFRLAATVNPVGRGRGIYKSAVLNVMFAVIGSNVYLIQPNLSFILIGTIATVNGDVFITEDNLGNVAFCDKQHIYIYNPSLVPVFRTLVLNFTPGYITFQDTRFLSVDLNASEWRLSNPLSPDFNLTFPFDEFHVGDFQIKPDRPLALVPFPGRGNLLLILGHIVGEFFVDAGLPKFPYQLATGTNVDFGTLNADTVANIDNLCAWLGINDRSGPVILASDGTPPIKISTDGIDFKLNSLSNPSDAHGFMFKQDGHIFYQLVFKTDNFSLTYDFNTKQFFTLTDSYMNYYPAKKVAFFNNTYYFVSLNDGNVYEMSTNNTTYNGLLIPRIRITKTFRMPNTAPFVANNLAFPIEQGVDSSPLNPLYYPIQEIITEDDDEPITTQNNLILRTQLNYYQMLPLNPPPLPVVDLAISNDGGQTFGNFYRQTLNALGNRKNRFIYYSLGWSNELTMQFRFFSAGRIVCSNGTMSVYQ